MTTMYLEPDDTLIKKVKLDNRKNRHDLRTMHVCKFIFYVISIAFMVCFPFYCRWKGYLIKVNEQTGEVSYKSLIIAMSVICLFLLMAMNVAHIMIKMYEDSLVSEQDNEFIEIDGKRLYYRFIAKGADDFTMRQVIVIDLTRLNKVDYDERLHVVTIDGMMVQKEIKMTCNMHSIKDEEMESCDLSLYDYFNPSIYESIKGYIKK